MEARQAFHCIFGQPFTQWFCGTWEILGDSSGPLEWAVWSDTGHVVAVCGEAACSGLQNPSFLVGL